MSQLRYASVNTRGSRHNQVRLVKSWGAPPKSLGVRIGNGATRRLTIYAFDPSVSQHVILVKELASRRSARESRGGAPDERQCLSTLLGSTHTDMQRARGPMAVHEQQRERRQPHRHF